MSVIQGTGYAASVTPSLGMAGYTAVLTVTAPDTTVTTPTVTTGVTFTATVPSTQAGNYMLVWTLTGSVNEVIQDQFTCEAASLSLVSLSRVKDDLNIINDTSKDNKLRQWIREATRVIETITGPILPISRIYVVSGGNAFLVLPDRWVISVTSMTENLAGTNYTLTEQPLGASTNSYGYTWDRSINKIVRRDGSGQSYFFPDGDDNVTVVYLAGMAGIPNDVQRAASLLVQYWYEQHEQPYRNTTYPGGEVTQTAAVGSYQVPYGIIEVLEPYRRTVGIF